MNRFKLPAVGGSGIYVQTSDFELVPTTPEASNVLGTDFKDSLSFRPDENRNNAVPDAGTGVSEWLFSSTRIIKEGHIETMNSMRTRMNPRRRFLVILQVPAKKGDPCSGTGHRLIVSLDACQRDKTTKAYFWIPR